jgi:hypothetical protein
MTAFAGLRSCLERPVLADFSPSGKRDLRPKVRLNRGHDIGHECQGSRWN